MSGVTDENTTPCTHDILVNPDTLPLLIYHLSLTVIQYDDFSIVTPKGTFFLGVDKIKLNFP